MEECVRIAEFGHTYIDLVRVGEWYAQDAVGKRSVFVPYLLRYRHKSKIRQITLTSNQLRKLIDAGTTFLLREE